MFPDGLDPWVIRIGTLSATAICWSITVGILIVLPQSTSIVGALFILAIAGYCFVLGLAGLRAALITF